MPLVRGQTLARGYFERKYGGFIAAVHPTHLQLQMGSLAGAAHLLKDNAGVLRWAQWDEKSHVEQKGKCSLDFASQ